MDYRNLKVTVDEGIATIVVDRPAVKNALNLETVHEGYAALAELAARDEVGALIITGAGESSFVSGADINDIRARESRRWPCRDQLVVLRGGRTVSEANHRGRERLRARWRLRAGARVRHQE